MKKINRTKFPVWLLALSLVLSVGLSLSACQNSRTALPDLSAMGEIVVVSREEGSGTRSEFETLTGSAGAGTDQIALSTDEVLETVSANRDSIGYLALSSVPEKAGVKILSVDGVVPDADTVKSGKYPLCRNYYLAYSGELNEAETDFMTYVLGAGQELVGQTCIPVNKAESFLSDKSAGEISISGSSSMAPLVQELIDDYKNYNPNVEFVVEITDSASGLTAAIRGECDIAMSSRFLKDYEAELLEHRAIAADGMAVVVNGENPLEAVTVKQLKGIFDGSWGTWGEVE